MTGTTTTGSETQVGARRASLTRETGETRVEVELDLDGSGAGEARTGIGFYDHMLEAFARHGRFDLRVRCEGDLQIDPHHTMEDVALAVGQAFDTALGERAGIVRMGDATVPLDEALVQAVIDLSGRPYAAVDLDFTGERIGEAPTELVPHVLGSFAVGARATLHVRQLAGGNDHHVAEAAMKALGRALAAATRPDERLAGRVPSTKGTLTA
jgi:imidazoleglycerol-phosphate dehydratase